jgi:hypothetical protein
MKCQEMMVSGNEAKFLTALGIKVGNFCSLKEEAIF